MRTLITNIYDNVTSTSSSIKTFNLTNAVFEDGKQAVCGVLNTSNLKQASYVLGLGGNVNALYEPYNLYIYSTGNVRVYGNNRNMFATGAPKSPTRRESISFVFNPYKGFYINGEKLVFNNETVYQEFADWVISVKGMLLGNPQPQYSGCVYNVGLYSMGDEADYLNPNALIDFRTLSHYNSRIKEKISEATSEVVRFTPQTLTDEQKQVARDNIDAVSMSSFSDVATLATDAMPKSGGTFTGEVKVNARLTSKDIALSDMYDHSDGYYGLENFESKFRLTRRNSENKDTAALLEIDYLNDAKFIGEVYKNEGERLVSYREVFGTKDVRIDITWQGEEAPYTQEIAVSGIEQDSSPIVDIRLSSDFETAQTELAEWSKIYRIETLSGKIKVYAVEPTETAITIQIKGA